MTTVDESLTVKEPGHGRDADAPNAIPLTGLRDVLWRMVGNIIDNRVTLIAAGVTYYLLLALFPAIGALVALYGFVADPLTIAGQIHFLADLVPPGGFDLIITQVNALTQQKPSALSLAFIGGLLVALWSANNGILAIFDAMNIAYGETEKRGFFKLRFMSLGFTLGALFVAVIIIAAIGVVPAVLAYLWLDRWTEILVRLARWPILLLIICSGITLIYQYGPSRENAKLRWLSWGCAFSTTLWLAASILFSYYIENFANYNATYGTLGTLIGFMVWTWISVIILIVGAVLNAELEHQTARDSTTGKPLPMGKRGAYVADTLGKTAD